MVVIGVLQRKYAAPREQGGDSRFCSVMLGSTVMPVIPRQGHAAVLLDDGTVLLLGGSSRTAELYDPTTGTFTLLGDVPFGQGVRSYRAKEWKCASGGRAVSWDDGDDL